MLSFIHSFKSPLESRDIEILPENSKEECKNGEGDVEVEFEECGNEFEEGHTSQ